MEGNESAKEETGRIGRRRIERIGTLLADSRAHWHFIIQLLRA
jgi:hypothetical protein